MPDKEPEGIRDGYSWGGGRRARARAAAYQVVDSIPLFKVAGMVERRLLGKICGVDVGAAKLNEPLDDFRVAFEGEQAGVSQVSVSAGTCGRGWSLQIVRRGVRRRARASSAHAETYLLTQRRATDGGHRRRARWDPRSPAQSSTSTWACAHGKRPTSRARCKKCRQECRG